MACADPENIFRGGGGGPNSQKGSDGNFNMVKINNLAIPGRSGPPVPPLDPPMDGSLMRDKCMILIVLCTTVLCKISNL